MTDSQNERSARTHSVGAGLSGVRRSLLQKDLKMRNRLVAFLTICVGMIFALLSTSASANPVGGSRTSVGIIAPRQSESFTITCRVGERCDFEIQGDGDGDIDCCLQDVNSGGVIECDVGSNDGCSLSTTPLWTGPFRLYFTNVGLVTSVYRFHAY
jgi:hypothetical protein